MDLPTSVIFDLSEGYRAFYDPTEDKCYFELIGLEPVLMASYDGVARMCEDGFFAPGWWMARELPHCAEYVRGITERVRRKARKQLGID